MKPYYLPCLHVAEQVDARVWRPIMIRHAEHFLCSYDEGMRCFEAMAGIKSHELRHI